ncbi:DDHD domain-domain-containing protein [Absidia repens]|uniref:DDHD domain-domain-containing protein n=1 Tax=Absidia repens TaxID=90262 RepID=A0A1X2HXS7_9FUNG|nr:DDHD domain-domain-containing protein [Absidia repens]
MVKENSDHLVFFLHGMGQQYEEYGRLEHHVLTMQNNTEQILQQQYPERNIRIRYVAIEWHSVVHALVDTKMEQATLETVPKVRLAINDWLMDCLYYFSKPYGQCIIDTVCQQCNDAYRQHVTDWPDFESNNGQVHMVGFSLGGIIGYDIASMQWKESEDGPAPWHMPPSSPSPSPTSQPNHDPFLLMNKPNLYQRRTPDLQVPVLDFPLRCLFTCGSPVAAALIFRGLDYMYYRPPLRTKMFNVFHPFDPLGYRIEPMLSQAYTSVRPVQLSRAQRQRILPKIPNLGIRSSLASAKPFISKARRTFWQYMATISSDSDETDVELDLDIEVESDDDSMSINNVGTKKDDNGDGEKSTTTINTLYSSTTTTTATTTTNRSSSLSIHQRHQNFISINTMASPVLSTISATMQQQPRTSSLPTLTIIKELYDGSVSPLPPPPPQPLDNEFILDTFSEGRESDRDEDYLSILYSGSINDEDMVDDDTASFFTATTFDTFMDDDDDEHLPPPSSSSTSTTSTSSSSSSTSLPAMLYGHPPEAAAAAKAVATATATTEVGLCGHANDSATTTTTSLLATDGLMYPRLDYMLTETVIDTYASEWIVAMKSHFKYWANRDLALHMVNVMVDEK